MYNIFKIKERNVWKHRKSLNNILGTFNKTKSGLVEFLDTNTKKATSLEDELKTVKAENKKKQIL